MSCCKLLRFSLFCLGAGSWVGVALRWFSQLTLHGFERSAFFTANCGRSESGQNYSCVCISTSPCSVDHMWQSTSLPYLQVKLRNVKYGIPRSSCTSCISDVGTCHNLKRVLGSAFSFAGEDSSEQVLLKRGVLLVPWLESQDRFWTDIHGNWTASLTCLLCPYLHVMPHASKIIYSYYAHADWQCARHSSGIWDSGST